MTGKVLIGLSGGINSMAVLCWLAEQEEKPTELHLYYAHFKEHSPDTFQFVADGIRFARQHFKKVVVKITRHSILDHFATENIIPHPTNSNCSLELKIKPISAYCAQNDIYIDLIGYVKHELKRRAANAARHIPPPSLFASLQKIYPIGNFTDAWCFEIVDKYIGWHPAIYDILWTEQDFIDGLCSKRDIGKRVFNHNNCLPCKNMYPKDMQGVKKHYPAYHFKAMELSARIALVGP